MLAHIRPTFRSGNHERVRRFALDKLLDRLRVANIQRNACSAPAG